jgi:hypothetical protein
VITQAGVLIENSAPEKRRPLRHYLNGSCWTGAVEVSGLPHGAGSRWGGRIRSSLQMCPVVTVAASTFALLLNAAVGGGTVLLALGLKNVAF